MVGTPLRGLKYFGGSFRKPAPRSTAAKAQKGTRGRPGRPQESPWHPRYADEALTDRIVASVAANRSTRFDLMLMAVQWQDAHCFWRTREKKQNPLPALPEPQGVGLRVHVHLWFVPAGKVHWSSAFGQPPENRSGLRSAVSGPSLASWRAGGCIGTSLEVGANTL